MTIVLTEEQEANLRKLSAFLKTVPDNSEHFNMASFFWHPVVGVMYGDVTNDSYECGTVACAAGHGPAAGCGAKQRGESWWSYVNRTFFEYHQPGNKDLFAYLFSDGWTHFPGRETARAAARRIDYVLRTREVPRRLKSRYMEEEIFNR